MGTQLVLHPKRGRCSSVEGIVPCLPFLGVVVNGVNHRAPRQSQLSSCHSTGALLACFCQLLSHSRPPGNPSRSIHVKGRHVRNRRFLLLVSSAHNNSSSVLTSVCVEPGNPDPPQQRATTTTTFPGRNHGRKWARVVVAYAELKASSARVGSSFYAAFRSK